jgi:hypothetical protein
MFKKCNEYKNTNTFCIVSNFEFIGDIHNKFGSDIVAICHDKKEHENREFTVRVTKHNGKKGLFDLYINCHYNGIQIIDEIEICITD